MRRFFLVSGSLFGFFLLLSLFNGRIGFFGCFGGLEMIGERLEGIGPFGAGSNSV